MQGKEISVGFRVKTLSNLFRRTLAEAAEELTGMQGWIIGYTYNEGINRDVYQRDIEAHFCIRRSTATKLLQSMEKNGLITRSSVKEDARLKKLVLTQKAIDLHRQFEASAQKLDSKAADGLTPEELKTFFEITDKIINNLNKKPDET